MASRYPAAVFIGPGTKASQGQGLPAPQRYWAVATIAVAVVLSVLDSAIANVALPTIAKDLDATPATSIWVVNAYQLAIVVLMLPFASLGEILGYQRIYRMGLTVFTLASLACALSGSLAGLTASRIVQGVGAAGVLSVNTALVRFVWPRDLLGRGIAVNALVVAMSAALGPTVAAAILSVADWPWLFAVNVPLGIAALAMTSSLPRVPGARRRFDILSAVLNAMFFGLLVIAIDGAGHRESVSGVLAEFAAAIAAGVALFLRQLPQTSPLLPIDLLRIPFFALSVATSICSFTAQMLAYVSLPFLFEDVLMHDAVDTGLLMTPWPLMTGLTAQLAGRLADRYSAGLLGGIGMLVFALGLSLLALMPAHPGTASIIWRMLICGFGFGMFQTPNNRAIISSAPRGRSGGASGMLGTARLLGQTVGAALVALAFTLFEAQATTIALGAAAAIALFAAVVSFTRLLDRNGVAGSR